MNVLLIIPPFINKEYYMPSLGVYILASSLINSDINVVVRDYSFEIKKGTIKPDKLIYFNCANDILKYSPDFICFSCNCMTILPAIRISQCLKKFCKTPIIIGGPIATTNAYDIIKYSSVDCVIVGEGEYALPTLIINYKNESIIKQLDILYKDKYQCIQKGNNSQRINYKDYNIIPAYNLMPEESEILKINKGKIFIPCEAGRGCAFSCSFCCSKKIWQQKVNFFSIELIKQQINAIKSKYNKATLYFTCDNLLYNSQLTNKICELLKKAHIKWQCRGRLDEIFDYEKMAHSGCEMMMIGIESAQATTWDKIHKGKYPKDLMTKLKKINKSGIGITATYIIGFPFENLEETQNTIMQACKVAALPNNDITIHALTPLPHTEIYQQNPTVKFNNGTDLVRGLEFCGELFEEDICLIKNDPSLFSSFYCFKLNNIIDNYIVEIADISTNLCKTPIVSNALFEQYNFDIKNIFSISRKCNGKLQKNKIVELIKKEILGMKNIPFLEMKTLLEIYNIECVLNGLIDYEFNNYNSISNTIIEYFTQKDYWIFPCSYNYHNIFCNKQFTYDAAYTLDDNSCFFVYNPKSKKYVILKSKISLEDAILICQKI